MTGSVIDIHVHIAGTGDSMAGCRMSNEFLLSPAFAGMMDLLDTTPFDVNDDLIRESVLNAVELSETTDYAVLLALDGVYKNGRYIKSESHFVIPNEYVIGIAKANKRVLFGASVHPFREKKDMLEETWKCIDNGAVLFKWIPSCQQIDPLDDRCIPFYKVLANEGVPLLCWTGEYVVQASGNAAKYGEPRDFERALDMGVKIIVSPGTAASEQNAGRIKASGSFNVLMDMLGNAEKNGWKLYVDVSGLSLSSGSIFLERIKEEIGSGKVSHKRFLYGSDFPMSFAGEGVSRRVIGKGQARRHSSEPGNPLDSNFKAFRESGLHDAVFTNASRVLRV